MNLLNEYGRVSGYIFQSVPSSLFMVLSSLAALGVAFYYDYVVVLAGLAVGAVCIQYVKSAGAQLSEVSRRDFPLQGKRQAVVSETTHNLDAIRAMAAERFFYERWLGAIAEASRSRWELNDVLRRYSFYSGIWSHLITMTVVLVGCLRMYQDALTVGELLALQILMTQAFMPLVSAGARTGQFQMATTVLRQMVGFLKPEEPGSTRRAHADARFERFSAIHVRNLTLTYPGASRPALKDVSFTLPDRGVVAIIGKNGSGKSSLVHAMIGLKRAYSGAVEIDGQDVRGFNPRWLRSRLGVVDQNSTLFSGTIGENLTAGMAGAVCDERIADALRFSTADRFVETFPGGLDHGLREGGQRQRLAISRAVLRAPLMAVFDEPTSALDAEAAIELERRIIASAEDRLTVIVTHHLFTARAAGLILVLDDGVLAGAGTHDTLMQSCAVYNSLWRDYTREKLVS